MKTFTLQLTETQVNQALAGLETLRESIAGTASAILQQANRQVEDERKSKAPTLPESPTATSKPTKEEKGTSK